MASAHTMEPGSRVALHIMGPFPVLRALSHPPSAMVPGRDRQYLLSKTGIRLRELMFSAQASQRGCEPESVYLPSPPGHATLLLPGSQWAQYEHPGRCNDSMDSNTVT